MLNTETVPTSARIDPRAYRMVAIAFLNQNVAIACIWGSFSVLLTSVEARLGIGRELSTLGAPAVNLSCALCAPFIGALAARYSLRLIMLAGAIFAVAGLVLLAVSHSFVLYMVAYGVFMGPAMAIGVVLPATLITKWFASSAGKALGIVTTQVIVIFIPLAATWVLHAYGLPMTYLAMAILPALLIVFNLFIIDHPSGAKTASAPNAAHGGMTTGPSDGPVVTMAELVKSPKLWGLAMPFIASATGTIILLAHMVPLARSWGYSAPQAALLLSVQSLSGLVGTLFFGWLADRLGGARTMAMVLFNETVLWVLMLWHPSFPAVVAIICLFGIHSSATVPVASLAYSQVFGQQNFSRAYGLLNLLNLPFSVLCVPVASYVFTRTGSYSGVIIGVIVFMGITCLLPLVGGKRPARLATS